MRIRSKILSALSLMLCLTTFAFPVLGAPGDLDPTFGTGGVVVTDLSGGNERINALALQPDGKILAAGPRSEQDQSGNNITRTVLARYHPDGSLDTTFGTGGFTTVVNGAYANSVTLQPDGKIVTGGIIYIHGDDFALARFNIDGSLDTTFGMDGLVTTNFFDGYDQDDQIHGLVIQPDGKILAAGYTSLPNFGYTFALARYNQDGSLDTDFGTGGLVNTTFTTQVIGQDIALQPDGKILVAGYSNRSWILARYNSNGSLDTGFGNGGLAPGVFYGYSNARALTLQPDGKIIVVGFAYGSNNFALARYNPDGSLDTGFGTGGTVINTIYYAEARDVVVQPNGKIVVVGFGQLYQHIKFDFVLARYNPDGSLDTDFGNSGIVYTPLTSAKYDMAYALLLQPDGKIVAGGGAGDTQTEEGGEKMGLVRYFGDIVEISDIEVFPNSHDFGDVPWGQTSTAMFTISNDGSGELTLSGIDLIESLGVFSITSAPSLPLILTAGQSALFEVSFSPKGFQIYDGGLLRIASTNGTEESLIDIPLSGTGVLADTPSEQVAAVVDYIENGIATGTLTGVGAGNSAGKKVQALINMIEAAGDLLEAGRTTEGCQQLADIYLKVDGDAPPPDFVAGSATAGLASAIQELRTFYRCQ